MLLKYLSPSKNKEYNIKNNFKEYLLFGDVKKVLKSQAYKCLNIPAERIIYMGQPIRVSIAINTKGQPTVNYFKKKV